MKLVFAPSKSRPRSRSRNFLVKYACAYRTGPWIGSIVVVAFIGFRGRHNARAFWCICRNQAWLLKNASIVRGVHPIEELRCLVKQSSYAGEAPENTLADSEGFTRF
jgi:hypothetical protein